ncbi:DUF4173 domain-containing protein [Bernardetia sp. MNP-M8]|uniref:DUF4153 domain-containing protein n=1 Tax=Bernardetia sp. MNP-M8 TaxID=3127470 RepID=UPI0030CDCE93
MKSNIKSIVEIKTLKSALMLLLLVIFNALFWNEMLGLNLFIFSNLLIGTFLLFHRKSFKYQTVRIAIGFTFVTGIMVLIHNSIISKIAHIVSFCLMLGFFQQGNLRLLSSAFWSSLVALVSIHHSFLEQINFIKAPATIPKSSIRKLRLLIIPLIAFSIFFMIFKIANPVFNKMTNNLGNQLFDILSNLFVDFSFLKILFLLLGAVIILVSLVKRETTLIVALWESMKTDVLRRELSRERRVMEMELLETQKNTTFKIMDLKQEYQTGILLIAMVNLLLLVVNGIDIQFLWLNFEVDEAGNLAELVHEGTYMLIISILLSMSILMYFFRKNLNFYLKNELLKKLAYVWIFQNTILVISVVIRTYYYIIEHGLAYKRIGVLLFLALTTYGLYSLFVKIKEHKSSFYLWRVNSWATYAMLVFMACINWDMLIVKYNIEKCKTVESKAKIDLGFMLSRSDQTLPILRENRQYFETDKRGISSYRNSPNVNTYGTYLDERIETYLQEQKKYSWASWNYADAKTVSLLEEK